MRELQIAVGKTKANAQLLDETAPKTCEAIWNRLPLAGDMHYAKIANTHEVFFIAPFVLPHETATAVSGLEPGSIIYWPNRQFIEIFFGPTDEVEEATNPPMKFEAWPDGKALFNPQVWYPLEETSI